MLTRKQMWRRTRSRKNSWTHLSPGLLGTMLTPGTGVMSKSVSWDENFAVGLKAKSDQVEDEARRSQEELAKAAATAATAAEEALDTRHIPRSVSCSSLSAKRSLFPRSASRDQLTSSRAVENVRRRGIDQRGVSFHTQVKMVLIPRRDEFDEEERSRLWWDREDYSRFRQVLIDWKRRNSHRISQADNILSIDLADIDDEDDLLHEEAIAAANATAAAAKAAAAAAAAKLAAEATAAKAKAAEAAATAAASAAATAAEVAATNEWEAAVQGTKDLKAAAAVAPEFIGWHRGSTVGKNADTERHLGNNGRLVNVGGPPVLVPVVDSGGNDLGRISENGQAKPTIERAGKNHTRGVRMAGGSFTLGDGIRDSISRAKDTAEHDRYYPLRRAFSISSQAAKKAQCVANAGRLREVPLSEKQATVESLRAWRQGLDARLAISDATNEDRRRSSSLQDKSQELQGSAVLKTDESLHAAQQSFYGKRGLNVATSNNEDDETFDAEQQAKKTLALARHSLGPHPAASDSVVDTTASNPIMATFERQQREATARQKAAEAREVAKAAAMVNKAAAEHAALMMEEASIARVASGKPPLGEADIAQAMEEATTHHMSYGNGTADELAGTGKVVQLGLNDNPESAAVAAAAGIRMAAEGVSNLSLRSRDSMENLQELAERAWGPVPLSSSAC